MRARTKKKNKEKKGGKDVDIKTMDWAFYR